MLNPIRKSNPTLIEAIREASKCAHQWRDTAIEYYNRPPGSPGPGGPDAARRASEWKKYYYSLKEKGIVEAHRQGELRYVGVAPNGMAVYEYGSGGMQCFHSCLHPAGVEKIPILDHPEVLFVGSRELEFKMMEVQVMLASLPSPTENYERVLPPGFQNKKCARAVYCSICGEPNHLAEECPF